MKDYRTRLKQWILEALHTLGGTAQIAPICRHIWENHEHDLRGAGDFFYVWQYDMRWAGQQLQKDGLLKKHRSGRKWELLK